MGGRLARIERVADEARAHGAVIDFEMMLSVPGERGDAVAAAQPECRERARQAVGAHPQAGIADAAGAGRDDLAGRRPLGGVVEELVYRESVSLHERMG
jgi:hypothetical protein